MRKLQVSLVGAGVLGALLLPATAADAASIPVGVNGCTASSQGGYAAGQCYSITQPGYYYLSVNNPSGGFASADVNCTQGGSISTGSFDWGYLNGGLCTVLVYGEYSTTATLGKY